MVSRIIKLDSSEPFKWPLFPHRFRSRIFGFGRNVTKIFLVFQLGEDITSLICPFNSTLDQLHIQTEDQQLYLREGASFLEELYAIFADKLLEMYNKLTEMHSDYCTSTEELIDGLDNQIATLKESIKSIDPTYYGNTLDEETSPSTPCKRPRLVDSGNSALLSPLDLTMV